MNTEELFNALVAKTPPGTHVRVNEVYDSDMSDQHFWTTEVEDVFCMTSNRETPETLLKQAEAKIPTLDSRIDKALLRADEALRKVEVLRALKAQATRETVISDEDPVKGTTL